MTLSAISGHYHNTIYFFPQEGESYPEHIVSHMPDKTLFVCPVRPWVRIVRIPLLVYYVFPHSFTVLLWDCFQCLVHRPDRIPQFRPPDPVTFCRISCCGSSGLTIRRRRRLEADAVVLGTLPLIIPDKGQRHSIQGLGQVILVVLIRLVIPCH